MRLTITCAFILVTMATRARAQNVNCANPVDVMFLMDGSDSIDASEWSKEKDFVARIVMALDISPSTVNVGFTVYSSDIHTHTGLNPFQPKVVLNAKIRNVEHPTGIATNTAMGIAHVTQTLKEQPRTRANAPKIMIVITDGTSVNPAETIRQAQDAKASGITIIAVGIGNTAFVEELREISSSPQHYYQAPDFDTLRGIETQIRNIICRVVTTTRAPIFVPPTQPPSLVPIQGNINCNNPADIIFLIDGSDSISDQDYVRLKSFVATLIENFEVSQQAIHVGLIVYSSAIGDKVPLSPFKNKFLLKALARNLNHPRLGTDTGGGLEAASNMIREQGRKNVPEMIVVITDGRSTIPYKTIMQAAKAKAEGITLIAIGVGKDIFSQELNVIASGPKYVSEVADFTSLESIINAMRDLICTAITTPTPITTTMMPITPPPSIDPPDSGLICTVPGDVIFVLDGSNSIHPNDWIRQRNFVSNLINNLEIGRQYIHVAVVVYSTGIGEVIPLVPFQPQSVLSNRVGKLVQPSYGTDTALGIERARQILTDQGRKDAPNVVIVVTDGKSTHPDRTHIQSMMAKADGVTMFAVGVGPDVFEDEMHNIASSGAQVFKVADFVSLQSIIKVLRDKICQVVQTTTSAPATMPTTTMPTTTVMVTPSLVQLYPCDESRTEADIMFLVGGTKTMSPYDWMMSKHLAANFLDGLAIAREFSHVGVVVSDSGRSDTIGMSPFKAKKYLQEMFRGLLHPNGDMDTATGLRKIQNFFDASGRPSSKKLVVYLTNGASASPADAAREADIMKRKGVDIVTMGIGNRLNSAELQALASKPTLTFSSPDSVSSFRRLPELQRAVCELLRKPITTTQAPTTPSDLCAGCLIDSGTGYNPVAGDCTRYVQCWRDGPHIRALVRSCPFGQFWDADAITCRPSFLVRCSADPCRSADSMFTYSMPEYGCRGYWKCIDGFSVGHCCPAGSAYVDGMGCRETSTCSEMCPPRGGVAVNPTCDRKPHWDSRYYIEIVYGRGEIVRPCPAGTIFYEKKCECDFGLSGLLPATPHVQCQPAASFPFNLDLMDKSQFGSNVGINGVRRTDLGTAHFNHNGTSNMNLWRFAGGDWGNQLVIKFKFRFDFSNKLVDYGGIPVDLGGPDMDLGLVSDYHMTDIDWRLWDRLRQIRSLEDWRRLLNEFGQSRTFYIFLGTLGFKPGTSNSHQVLSILSTPEAYAQFQILLDQMQGRLNADVNIDRATSGGLREILTLLRSMRDVIDWGLITRRLRGEETVTVPPNAIAHLTGTGEYLWDGRSSMWIRTAPSGTLPIPPTVTWQGADEHLLNIGGTETASEWRFNEKSGQWERYAAIDIGGGHHGQYEWLTASDARAAGEQTSQTSGNAGVEFWQWNATGSQQPIRASTSVNGTGSYAATGNSSGGIAGMSWQDILNMLNDAQNNTSGTWQWTTHGTSGDTTRAANQQALEALMRQFNIGGGGSGGVGGSATWQWNASVDRPTSQGLTNQRSRLC
ncbi:hypothetical protein DPMN_188609 [Dreissena polymorpha]|uniref:Uncharacterized protein n=1 Tax=Dreissena polymorpha TaxID=45954 RepID=A0A9D4IA71_DREPO|nr:hypothetical protein DPMN_188609 [Dreissena polymorpha]